jgi:hypothetical protein
MLLTNLPHTIGRCRSALLLGLAGVALAATLVLTGCDVPTQHAAAAQPPAVVAQAATATAPRTAPDDIDRLLDAVVRQDREAVLALVDYTSFFCLDAPDGPPARPLCADAGAPSGTRVPVLPFVTCAPFIEFAGTVPQYLDLVLFPDARLYGVLATTDNLFADLPGGEWMTPDTAVFVENPKPLDFDPALRHGSAYYLRAGRVISVGSFGVCGASMPPADDPAWRIPPR